MLDGHEFIINNFIPSPFITTKLSSGLGFATSLKTEIPLLRFADSTSLKVDADISYSNGNFEYQNALTDWAAMWINFSGVARLGTNTASVLVAGVTANTEFNIGMLFKIMEFRNSMFSSSLSINNSSSSVLNIYPFIRGLLDTTYPYSSNHIVNSFNPLSGTIDFRGAYKPDKSWSILGYLSGGYGENVEIDQIQERFIYEFGGSVNYNLNEKNHIPIGFGAAFKLNSASPTLEYTKKVTQTYMLQIAYTGRKDFIVSFESNYLRIPTNYQNVSIKLSAFSFGWAYFF